MGGRCRVWLVAVLLASMLAVSTASAHHILGKPAYNANGDASTPPSISLETQIGKYNVTMMAFPIELKVRQPVRIKLYATRLDGGQPFNGNVTFSVRDDDWLPAEEETVGVQPIDDNGVYTQAIEFRDAGHYLIIAKFDSDGEPYIIDFPVVVGKPIPFGFLVVSGGLVVVVLGGVSLAKRRRRMACRG